MNNLTLRLISAFSLTGISFTLFIISISTRWIWLSIFIGLAAWEFSRLIYKKYSPDLKINSAWTAALLTLPFLWSYNPWYNVHQSVSLVNYTWAAVLLTTLVYVLSGFKKVSIEQLAAWIFLHIFGVLFFGLWVAQIYDLFEPRTGLASVTRLFLVVLCMTAADSGAYFAGRAFGKRKLSPVISPKKTIEGVMGGALLTIILMVVFGPGWGGLSIIQSVIFAIVMVFTAVVGDLLISSFKRFATVKDTSNAIPGHGGVLDRFDSLFFSIPFATLLFRIFQT